VSQESYEPTEENVDSPEVEAVEAQTEDVASADFASDLDDAGLEAPAQEVAEEEEDEDEEEDPYEAFRRELAGLEGDWYVIHSYAGYENRVKTNLETRIQSLNMEDYIFQIEVPMEEVAEIKNATPRV
jgi:transcriptional antiterminator NusG